MKVVNFSLFYELVDFILLKGFSIMSLG